MMVLGIGDYGATTDPKEVIKTIGLGSCVAVIFSDTAANLAGMIHIALPDSSLSPDKKVEKPGYFADTGLPALCEMMQKAGWRQGAGKLTVRLVGGASVMDPHGTFNIGKRNVLAIKKILWGMGMGPMAEDIGGTISRTVSIAALTGTVLVTSPSREPLNL